MRAFIAPTRLVTVGGYKIGGPLFALSATVVAVNMLVARPPTPSSAMTRIVPTTPGKFVPVSVIAVSVVFVTSDARAMMTSASGRLLAFVGVLTMLLITLKPRNNWPIIV